MITDKTFRGKKIPIEIRVCRATYDELVALVPVEPAPPAASVFVALRRRGVGVTIDENVAPGEIFPIYDPSPPIYVPMFLKPPSDPFLSKYVCSWDIRTIFGGEDNE